MLQNRQYGCDSTLLQTALLLTAQHCCLVVAYLPVEPCILQKGQCRCDNFLMQASLLLSARKCVLRALLFGCSIHVGRAMSPLRALVVGSSSDTLAIHNDSKTKQNPIEYISISNDTSTYLPVEPCHPRCVLACSDHGCIVDCCSSTAHYNHAFPCST
jgi:hypothetical protein